MVVQHLFPVAQRRDDLERLRYFPGSVVVHLWVHLLPSVHPLGDAGPSPSAPVVAAAPPRPADLLQDDVRGSAPCPLSCMNAEARPSSGGCRVLVALRAPRGVVVVLPSPKAARRRASPVRRAAGRPRPPPRELPLWMVAWMSERPRVGVAEAVPPPPSSSSASTSSSCLRACSTLLLIALVMNSSSGWRSRCCAAPCDQLVVHDLILEQRVFLLLIAPCTRPSRASPARRAGRFGWTRSGSRRETRTVGAPRASLARPRWCARRCRRAPPTGEAPTPLRRRPARAIRPRKARVIVPVWCQSGVGRAKASIGTARRPPIDRSRRSRWTISGVRSKQPFGTRPDSRPGALSSLRSLALLYATHTGWCGV